MTTALFISCADDRDRPVRMDAGPPPAADSAPWDVLPDSDDEWPNAGYVRHNYDDISAGATKVMQLLEAHESAE